MAMREEQNGRPPSRYWYLIITLSITIAGFVPHLRCHLQGEELVGPIMALIGIAALLVRPSVYTLRIASITLLIYSFQFCATSGADPKLSLLLFFMLVAQIFTTHFTVRERVKYV